MASWTRLPQTRDTRALVSPTSVLELASPNEQFYLLQLLEEVYGACYIKGSGATIISFVTSFYD